MLIPEKAILTGTLFRRLYSSISHRGNFLKMNRSNREAHPVSSLMTYRHRYSQDTNKSSCRHQRFRLQSIMMPLCLRKLLKAIKKSNQAKIITANTPVIFTPTYANPRRLLICMKLWFHLRLNQK